jgi:ABC-type uncharacterized transport system involved in gliding motility auxiliary subunit
MNRSAIQKLLREYGYITGPVSLAMLAAAVFRKLVLRAAWNDGLLIGFLVGGVLLGAAFILGNPTQVRSAITRRGTLYGLNAAAMSLAFIAILVFLNYVAGLDWAKYDHDFTETKVHTLSPQSKQVVAEIDQEVHIVGFFTAQDFSQRKAFQELLDQYKRADTNNFIRHDQDDIIDPDREPLEARQYEEPYRGLLIQSGDRTERVFSASEQDITSALLKVAGGEAKVVYFLTGHGERDPNDGSDAGYSTVAQNLKRQNYEVQSLNLAITDTIPSNASVIVIAGPRAKLLEGELLLLQSYLSRGGRALIMQDPFDDGGLDIVLEAWQVRFGEGFIVDELQSAGSPAFPAAVQYDYTSITKDMNGLVTLFPEAGPVEQTAETPAGVTYSTFFETSERSWSETSTEVMALDDADTAGPLALAALVESPPHYTSEDSESAKTRIVLIGDSDFASNAFAEVPGNTVLFGNAVNWLAEEERLIAIGPKDARRDPVVFKTDVQRSVVFFINVLGIPGLILAAGITVWVIRRVALSQWSNAARRQDDETA